MSDFSIERLTPQHAAAISDCFRRVYGETYANELFYDLPALATALEEGRLCSVGALTDTGGVMAHMAMVCHPGARFAELGNTVVDPAARGGGLAWKVGDELARWCIEAGYPAYLHYPTTDHHIMQRRSVERGFETGLMLGYIPAETDGQVNADKAPLRSASTVVYNPFSESPADTLHAPGRYRAVLEGLAEQCRLERSWQTSNAPAAGTTDLNEQTFGKRGLRRYEVTRIGSDVESWCAALATDLPCEQLDLPMEDPALEVAVEAAIAAGFVFCAWMPGYRARDVLRLQRVATDATDLAPAVVNPVAQALLEQIREEITRSAENAGRPRSPSLPSSDSQLPRKTPE